MKTRRFNSFYINELKLAGISEKALKMIFQICHNIIQMAEKVIEVLKNKYLLSFIRYEGLQRIEDLEIPEDALREAIFNSIIHKNYAGVAIQMKIWSDRIELWNDGEFPFGFTEDDLKNGRKSKPRNKNIANAFYKAGFVESWGRGIKKICNKFSAAGLSEPVFENFCGGVNVTIPRNNPEVKEFSAEYLKAFGNSLQKTGRDLENDLENDGSQKSSQKSSQKIIELIKNNPEITTQQIADSVGISRRAVAKQIAKLRADGKIERVGPDKGGHWQVN